MPESSKRNKNRRTRRPSREGKTPISHGVIGDDSRPRIRPKTWRVIRRWALYVAFVVVALAVIGGFVAQGFAGTGQGGGQSGTGDAVGIPVNPMPIIYPPSNHIPQGDTFNGKYNSTPPTSGPHWGSGWASCGIHDDQLPDEQIVHNMEHGQVVIGYNLKEDAEIERLIKVVEGLSGRRSWVVVHPYTEINQGEITVSSWGWMDTFEGVQEERIKAFYEAHKNNSGVEQIPCAQSMG